MRRRNWRIFAAALLAAALPLAALGQVEKREPALQERRSDEEIRRDVLQQLAWDVRVPATGIQVEVNAGTVVLSGHVPTILAKRSAALDAQDIPGVCRVENGLRVDYALSSPPDEAIARRVRMILDWVPEIEDISEIDVTVTDGKVYLEGIVDELWKRERIAELAAIPYGVAEVDNGIAVVPADRLADERIAQQIQEALRRTLGQDAAGITVTVQGGKVSLDGRIPSWTAYRLARQAAVNTRGAVQLVSRLQVE